MDVTMALFGIPEGKGIAGRSQTKALCRLARLPPPRRPSARRPQGSLHAAFARGVDRDTGH